MSNEGPKVWSRPGTKRHLAQVRARAVFFAIQASGARAAHERAVAAHQAAIAAQVEAQANLDAFTFLACALLPAVGSA